MDLARISDVLQNYNGQEESMQQVVSVLQEELGDNWVETVFEDLQSLSPALKENLTHAYNYYAATMAWNEVQTYLNDETLVRSPEVESRLPILKHWLDFFGAPGQEAYKSLEDRLNSLPEEPVEPEAEVVEQNLPVEDDQDDVEKITEAATESEKADEPEISGVENAASESAQGQELDEDAEKDVDAEAQKEPTETEVEDDDPARFAVNKIKNQLALLDQNQAWLAARCVQLKNIEIYAYPFYGFIVDLLRQTLKGMNEILADEANAALLDDNFEGGQEAFKRKKEAIEHDIELAEQNCESAVTALISDDIDMDEVRRTLGTIDDSDSVEYVGPAPDGFELVDDETPLDENAIKKQYEKIEKVSALGGEQVPEEEKNAENQENTSQNEQKGVQRKLSFSLKRKKPTGDAT